MRSPLLLDIAAIGVQAVFEIRDLSVTPSMVFVMTMATLSTAADALSEDRRGAWAPDPLGWGDAAALLETATPERSIGPVEVLAVPKPDGSTLSGSVLTMQALGRLYRAGEPLRAVIDDRLHPGVCGYRRGSEPGLTYSTEHVRFSEISRAEAEQSGFVVLADVRKFFEHLPWQLVLDCLDELVGADTDLAPIRDFALDAEKSGLSTLPAGYGDARMLSNVVLAKVDQAIEAPFVRWIDDYQIFTRDRNEASAALEDLRSRLDKIGLSLNDSKVSIVPAPEFLRRSDAPLGSVYHPEVEGVGQVRAALRSVFFDAAPDPVKNRRQIRFVLPRLKAQRDDVAVEWALTTLSAIPWEAPRVCAYLSAFKDDPHVSSEVEALLLDALDDRFDWLAMRLAALTGVTGVSPIGAAGIAAVLPGVASRSLRSLLVRTLSLSHHNAHVEAAVESGRVDSRAALAALTDIGMTKTWKNRLSVPEATRELLSHGPAPAPSLDAIL